MAQIAESRTLHSTLGRWSWAWLAALLLALGLQIAGLLMPFLRIAVFIKGGEDYSLLRTVSLLWHGDLYVLALLILGFSVVFPFVKIALLFWAWLFLRASPRRTLLLDWLGTLGRWSMLDPLSVLVLVLLATDQWAVSTTTFVGVYAFLSAITITMILSVVASAADARSFAVRTAQPQRRRSLLLHSGWRGAAAVTVLCAAATLFAGALTMPFLQVNQFLLRSSAYGVGSVPGTMIHDENWPLALLSATGLMAVPALTLLAEAWAWIVPARPLAHTRRWRLIAWIREWCMLDVMGLALALFLWEGQRVIRVDIRFGLWMLIATALLLWASGWLGMRAAAVGIRRLGAE